MRNLIKVLGISMVIVMSCMALMGCGNNETQKEDDEKQENQGAEEEKQNENVEDTSEFEYAGVYTLVDGDITYALTIEPNEDYTMTVTRQFDGFTATKHYAGPMKNIEGAHMATMPVFLSDLVYEGENAPEDSAAVYEKMNEVYQAQRGATEEERMFFITVDKDAMTFVCDEGQQTKLDPTEGYWIASDFAE